MHKAFAHIRKTAHRFADADMVFWLMPPLIVLLIVGTIAQRWMGLWPAIDLFFDGFILWAGPIPLPGAYMLLGILSLNLTFKFLLKSEWSWRKSGIILSHLGALILLFGGLITAIDARESFMLIPEGAQTSYIYSYTSRELVVYKNRDVIGKYDFNDLKNATLTDLPFEITIRKTCENCDILKREETDNFDENTSYQSMAQFMSLTSKTSDPNPELNLTGFEFDVKNTDADGRYIAFDGMPAPIEITQNNETYTLIFGKAQSELPFAIALNDFQAERYGGTTIAQSYASEIVVKDGDIAWPARIEMNKPLRYKGYTFFQSSFEQSDIGEATILAVVENTGWLFPYIGTLVIGIGLILHMLIILQDGAPKRRAT